MDSFRRNNVLITIALLLVLLMIVWFWNPFRQQTAPPQDAIAPVAEEDATAATVATVEQATASPEEESAPDEAEQEAAQEDNPEEDSDEANAASAPQRFVIVPEESEARFIIDEILFGDPNTVVGSTSVVSGALTIDQNDPAQTNIDPIVIDASELATDNRFRNRSLSRMILQSNRDEYQYITFVPTDIEGLPATAEPGMTTEFSVSGDLTIRDISTPETFAVTVTATSASEISGIAVTTVQRADYALEIPDVDGVAEVGEDVRLEFSFVATAALPREE